MMARTKKTKIEDIEITDLDIAEIRELIKKPSDWENVVKEKASIVLTKILFNLSESDLKNFTPKTIGMLLPILIDILYSFKAPKITLSEEEDIEAKKQKLRELVEKIKKEYPEVVEVIKEGLGGREDV